MPLNHLFVGGTSPSASREVSTWLVFLTGSEFSALRLTKTGDLGLGFSFGEASNITGTITAKKMALTKTRFNTLFT